VNKDDESKESQRHPNTALRRSIFKLERMKKEATRRSAGATLFAVILGWLGVAGVLNVVAWPLVRNSEMMKSAPADFIARFPPALGSWWLSLLALAYGVSALWTARALWRMSPSAVRSYVAWAVSVVLIVVILSVVTPGVSVAAAAAFLVLVLALLAGGWLITRRLVQA
jgi:hypothetical protein